MKSFTANQLDSDVVTDNPHQSPGFVLADRAAWNDFHCIAHYRGIFRVMNGQPRALVNVFVVQRVLCKIIHIDADGLVPADLSDPTGLQT
jgi:hypothetical protein